MGALQTGLLTVEEFLKLPKPKEGHIELHHGEVVEMPPPKKGHQRIQNRLQGLLQRLAGDRYVVHMEMAFRPTPEHEIWVADVGCVSRERDEATGDDDYLMGAPEIVIEVLSASNTMDEVLDRQDICLDNGSVVFWTVDPKRKTVMCTTVDRATSTYNSNMKAPLPPTVAEYMINVAEIFK
jgi:Uma2 family endonuclease